VLAGVGILPLPDGVGWLLFVFKGVRLDRM
jgi:hypothetical protein